MNLKCLFGRGKTTDSSVKENEVAELREAVLKLEEVVKDIAAKEDADTIYDDTALRELITDLSKRVDDCERKEDKDTIYDDSDLRGSLDGIKDMVSQLSEAPALTGVVDLSSVFKAGKASAINEAIQANASNVIYVGPGNYNIDGSIILAGIKYFYCFGNLIGPSSISKIKPLSQSWPSTTKLYRNDVIRTFICYNGSQNTCYINKITVRHNYCAFYIYYAKSAHIKIDTITGSYTAGSSKKEYCSVFNNGAKFTSTKARKAPISDDWLMNAGFMTDHLADSTIEIGGIDNLNYGIYFIETIPDKNPDTSLYTGINFNYIEIMCNTFNIDSIVCKKAVTFDFEHSIEINDNVTTYTTKHSRSGNNIHGNVFNINGFDYTTATSTNSIETMNPTYYDQSKDNRRIMFNIIGKSNDTSKEVLANNTFNVCYFQGVYDVVVNAVNVSCLTWNGYLQVNDVYFNDGTSHSQRNKKASKYTRGTASGYEDTVTITTSPVLIFDNCYNITFNNIERSFIRPNEVSITNCKNVRINQMSDNDNSDFYHRILESNYASIQNRLYDGSDVYAKKWNDGFEKL